MPVEHRAQLLQDCRPVSPLTDLPQLVVLAGRRELDLDPAVLSAPRRFEELTALAGRPAEPGGIQRRRVVKLPVPYVMKRKVLAQLCGLITESGGMSGARGQHQQSH